jgi:hypothetical protein
MPFEAAQLDRVHVGLADVRASARGRPSKSAGADLRDAPARRLLGLMVPAAHRAAVAFAGLAALWRTAPCARCRTGGPADGSQASHTSGCGRRADGAMSALAGRPESGGSARTDHVPATGTRAWRARRSADRSADLCLRPGLCPGSAGPCLRSGRGPGTADQYLRSAGLDLANLRLPEADRAHRRVLGPGHSHS